MQLEILEHVLNKTAEMSCVQLSYMYIIATSDTDLPYEQSEHLLKQVIMKITLCSTFFYKSVTRYKICFPLFEIIILNITSSGDYFDLSNHLHG